MVNHLKSVYFSTSLREMIFFHKRNIYTTVVSFGANKIKRFFSLQQLDTRFAVNSAMYPYFRGSWKLVSFIIKAYVFVIKKCDFQVFKPTCTFAERSLTFLLQFKSRNAICTKPIITIIHLLVFIELRWRATTLLDEQDTHH